MDLVMWRQMTVRSWLNSYFRTSWSKFWQHPLALTQDHLAQITQTSTNQICQHMNQQPYQRSPCQTTPTRTLKHRAQAPLLSYWRHKNLQTLFRQTYWLNRRLEWPLNKLLNLTVFWEKGQFYRCKLVVRRALLWPNKFHKRMRRSCQTPTTMLMRGKGFSRASLAWWLDNLDSVKEHLILKSCQILWTETWGPLCLKGLLWSADQLT